MIVTIKARASTEVFLNASPDTKTHTFRSTGVAILVTNMICTTNSLCLKRTSQFLSTNWKSFWGQHQHRTTSLVLTSLPKTFGTRISMPNQSTFCIRDVVNHQRSRQYSREHIRELSGREDETQVLNIEQDRQDPMGLGGNL